MIRKGLGCSGGVGPLLPETKMRRMSDTIARLAAAASSSPWGPANGPSRLEDFTDFGTNPGALRAHVHVPAQLQPGASLVVVLHGCTQTAAGYDQASGWSDLADQQGFALLYPEQSRANNANGCFNWFEPADAARNRGEALSIRQMITSAVERLSLDPTRIFITGLSAGGAMAATMLAAYPEIFAGGAIIAGLPHGAANGMVQAFDRMRGHGLPTPARLQELLLAASDHRGPWPRIAVWHGSADRTVSADNATAIVAQWRSVHGLTDKPTAVDLVGQVPRRMWQGPDGRVLVEEYIVPGMAHGTPLKTSGTDAYGSSAPFMLDVGISSTLHIAAFWGLAEAAAERGAPAAAPARGEHVPARVEPRRLHGQRVAPDGARAPAGVGKVIEDALRAAGLMK